METYELFIKEEDSKSGVFAVGLVDNPAIKETWIAMSEQKESKITLFSDETKYELVGPLMIPNQLILRVDSRGSYNVYFTEQTVKLAQERFFSAAYNSKSTHQHEIGLMGNTVIESWIIEDTKMDKSKLYGYDLPVGTWMIKLKVNDKEYWDNYIKTGIVRGFSLEGYFNELKLDLKMDSKETKMVASVNQFTIDKAKLEINEDKQLTLVDTDFAMPEGEYTTDEGYVICVNEMKKVVKVYFPDYSEEEELEDYLEDSYFSEAKKVEMKKSADVKKTKKMKNKSALSAVLEAIGFKFNEDKEIEKNNEKEMKSKGFKFAEGEITQEITFPATGGEMEIETPMGKYKLVITPIPAEPATNPAQTGEPVAAPTEVVSNLESAEMQALKTEMAEIKNHLKVLMKSAPNPVSFEKDVVVFSGQKEISTQLSAVERIKAKKSK